MEEISVKGEDYVKAAVIAKKFGYTADYIGQLCRSKQVKSTLVGRSWYVNEESLLEHKKGRYRSNLTKSKEAIQKNTAERKSQTKSFDPRYLNRLVRYDSDENDLLPIVTTKEIFNETPEKIENNPENITILTNGSTMTSESVLPPALQSLSARRPTAVLRTIPALRPTHAVIKSPLKHTETLHRRSGLSLALLIAFVLVSESLMLSALLGLEKKLMTATDGSEIVLYNFNPTEISNSASVIFAQMR